MEQLGIAPRVITAQVGHPSPTSSQQNQGTTLQRDLSIKYRAHEGNTSLLNSHRPALSVRRDITAMGLEQ